MSASVLSESRLMNYSTILLVLSGFKNGYGIFVKWIVFL